MILRMLLVFSLMTGSVLALEKFREFKVGETVLPKLSSADQEKLERHRALVHDLETGLSLGTPNDCNPSFSSEGHIIDQFSRITTMALACDLTRVATIVTQDIPGSQFGLNPGVDMHQD